MEGFDFLATVLVTSGGGNGNGGGSLSDGTGIWFGLGVIIGAVGIGDRGSPSTVTVDVDKTSVEKVFFQNCWKFSQWIWYLFILILFKRILE